jgi:hypothetical protein
MVQHPGLVCPRLRWVNIKKIEKEKTRDNLKGDKVV